MDLDEIINILESGGIISPDGMRKILGEAEETLERGATFDEKELIYLFVSSILSSPQIPLNQIAEFPTWRTLYAFAEDYDRRFYAGEI